MIRLTEQEKTELKFIFQTGLKVVGILILAILIILAIFK